MLSRRLGRILRWDMRLQRHWLVPGWQVKGIGRICLGWDFTQIGIGFAQLDDESKPDIGRSSWLLRRIPEDLFFQIVNRWDSAKRNCSGNGI